jgi:broad specificity polyphosphatase/5'/3'-nucleotidase SurE
MSYPDGWKIYAIHGTLIPQAWIEAPATLTPSLALSQTNAELRRAACELLGWAQIINGLNAKLIDRDPDPEIGELLEVNHPQIGKERFLRVLCGTKREFCLPVPRGVKTALQANAWTWGMAPKEYKPEIRT